MGADPVISLSISRTGLTIPGLPLTISDSGTGTYVLVSYAPGAKSRENAVAQSRWLDGGALVSTRTSILTMDLVVQVRGASVSAILDNAAILDEALDQFGYTITEQVAGALTSTQYACMPANTSFPYDPVMFRAGLGMFTASIPRQP